LVLLKLYCALAISIWYYVKILLSDTGILVSGHSSNAMGESADSEEEYFDAKPDVPVDDKESKGPLQSFALRTSSSRLPAESSYEFNRYLRKLVPMDMFPSLEELDADFSNSKLKLKENATEHNLTLPETSSNCWEKQLLCQTQSVSFPLCTVAAHDCNNKNGKISLYDKAHQLMPPPTNLRRSESAQSPIGSRCTKDDSIVSTRMCTSANNSRNSTIEQAFAAEVWSHGAPVLPYCGEMRQRNEHNKSSSLTRDFCGVGLNSHYGDFPLQDLIGVRRKSSSVEMEIDALASELSKAFGRAVCRRGTCWSEGDTGSVESSKTTTKENPTGLHMPDIIRSNCLAENVTDSGQPLPVRPPRLRKMQRKKERQLHDTHVDGSGPTATTNPNTSHRSITATSKPVSVPAGGDVRQVVVDKLKCCSNMRFLQAATRSFSHRTSGGKEAVASKREHLPEGLNPLSLHMMRLTEKNNGGFDSESVSSGGSASLGQEEEDVQSVTSGKSNLGHAVKKKMRSVWHIAEGAIARQQLSGKEESSQSEDEEVGTEGNRVTQVRASHHNKGPFYFDQLKLVQDLSKFHVGAVWCMNFSDCGRLLATAGQDSVIRIWVLKSAFKHFSDMRARYCSKGEASLSDLPSRENSFTNQEEVKSFIEDEKRSLRMGATGEEGEARQRYSSSPVNSADEVWAPFMPNPLCSFRGHSSDVLDDDRYFISGSLDGKIRLWLIPEKKVVNWNELDEGQLVTAVTFVKNGELVAVGTYNGRCIFYTSDKLSYHAQIDLRRYGFKRHIMCKITGLDSYQDKLLITCNDSRIRLYDVRDLTLVCKYRGFTNRSSQIRARFSHNGQFIIAGSEDSMVYMWKTRFDSNALSLPGRKDRSRHWESIKAHQAVVTSALFAPKPDVIFAQIERARRRLLNSDQAEANDEDERCRKSQLSQVSIDTKSVQELIVSADFSGVISVFLNRPKVVAGSRPLVRTFACTQLLGNKAPTRVSTPSTKVEATAADTSTYVYGEGDTMIRLDWWNSGQRHTSWAKWGMLRDWRRRKLVAQYSDLRLRMKAIAKNDVLPTAVKHEMVKELKSLPRYCDPKYLKNTCQITGRRRVSLAASLSFLHVPSTIRLPNVDVVLTSELQAIQESFFGLSAEAPSAWLNSGNLWQRPEAIVLFDLTAPDHLRLPPMGAKSYKLQQDAPVDFTELWSSMEEEFADESPLVIETSVAGISGVPDNTFNQAVENESSPPLFAADSNSHSTLKVELAAANALNTWLKSAPQLRNGVPDFYLVSFEALSLFDEPSIGGSEAARSAVREIVTVIEKISETVKKRYDGNCVLEVISTTGARSRKPRAAKVEHSSELHRSKRSAEKPPTNYAFYDENYSVIFNICLWLVIAFACSLLYIGVGMWSMDPGRESIVYRMTMTRAKKD
ncbi:hypothetical protein M514_15054, partial [Trichuris suis]